MLNENQINMLPERIYERLSRINTEYLEMTGNVIKKIGELRPTDVHRLQQMYDYGADLRKVTQKLAETSGKNVQEIYDMFDIVAKENYDYAKPFYKAQGLDFIPYEENEDLQKYVKSLAKQTAGEYVNLTQHTAFAVFSKDGKSIAPLFANNKDKLATSLSDTYTNLIDYAVTKVQLGESSYNAAMREVMKAMASSGIKTVDYATGYSRRLDSAVRQNILWGVKQCNQNAADQIGKEFGADGYEISYHSNPRPSHADMGGKQFAIGPAREVNGVYYPSFEEEAEPLLDDYGCLHFKFSILLGVSRPAYSREQLEAFKSEDNKTFEFEGEPYTKYEARQMQGKLESAMMRQKDLANIAKAAGDDDLRREAQGNINLLTSKYHSLCQASGLPTRAERMNVSGFRAVKTVDKSVNSGIINTKLLNNRVINPMNVDKYKKMRSALEKQGIKFVPATEGDDFRYLLAQKAEAIYANGYISHIGETPSASAFFEEIIHLAQERKYGVMSATDFIERDAREVAANRKLLKFYKQYGFDNYDYEDVKINLGKWEKSFERRVGIPYDESEYKREV